MRSLAFFLLISFSTSVVAQSSARFAITRGAVAGGGATAGASSRFRLDGTIAQPLAAVPGGARFSIQGGFWIQPAPIVFAPVEAGSSFIFSFQPEPGETYTAQYVDSLSTLNWQSLPVVAGDGTVKSITNSAPGVAQRFYRLDQQP